MDRNKRQSDDSASPVSIVRKRESEVPGGFEPRQLAIEAHDRLVAEAFGATAAYASSHVGNGFALGWAFPGECCTACVARDLRDGEAVLADPAALDGAIDVLLGLDEGRGRGVVLAQQLMIVREAWRDRGQRQARDLVRALEYLDRCGQLDFVRRHLSEHGAVGA
ncbi:MAG TPA: hypothetical protein VHC63_15280 [Acidimicrobiales bacterium]|nr:hypothetical protein [Acidimicrobiales bacterium]